MSGQLSACGTDVPYTLTINIQNHKAAEILNNGFYSICVGYPEDDQGFSNVTIKGTSPNFHCSRPVKASFSASPVADVDYLIGYANEFSPTSQVHQMKKVEPGRVYRIDDCGVARVEEASWISSNALGFENASNASPVVFRRRSNDPGAAATRFKTLPVWVPGRGVLVPPNPSMSLKVWLKSELAPEDEDDLGTQDESKPFHVKYKKGNPTATILFKEDGTFGLNQFRVCTPKTDEDEEL